MIKSRLGQGYKVILMLISLLIFTGNIASSPLKVAFGNSLFPWVLPDQDKGILVDLTRASFQFTEYQVKAVYYPYARRIKAYKNGQVDVVTDITPEVVLKENLQGYLSERFYYYENVAVFLSQNNFTIDSLDDLALLRVLAWQGAAKTLSQDYAKMALANPYYKETYDQQSQIEMLFRRRVDVIQLDTQIFYYIRHKVALEGKIDTSESVNYAPILGRNYCAFLFRDKAARDVFNQQIKQLKKEDKEYQSIYLRYTSKFANIAVE